MTQLKMENNSKIDRIVGSLQSDESVDGAQNRFKAMPMPDFTIAHANEERRKVLRQRNIQITVPTTPEVMKRPKVSVTMLSTTFKMRHDLVNKINQRRRAQLQITMPVTPEMMKRQRTCKNDAETANRVGKENVAPRPLRRKSA